MFFAILFLVAAALGAHLFPEAAWATILISAFAIVAGLRLTIWFAGRGKADKG